MAIYPLRTVLATAFHLVVGLVPVMVVSGCVNGWIGPTALLSLIPSLLLLLALGWAIAVAVGLLNVWFRDTRHLTDIFMQVFFYLTPIIYPPSVLAANTWHAKVMRHNPLAPFINLVRNTILHNQPPSLTQYGMGMVAAVLCVGLAAVGLWKKERRLIFYL
jgi:ABC-type polysaccharide/polyol phosphate export permease